MYVITFYSFKGGVGRTMALVNLAAELARRGRKVLVVDFDLEAPGLETYKRLQPPKAHPGIVEYVTEYREKWQVPNLRDFIYETQPIGKKGGRLWVMPAGRRDRAYRTALANLDWQRLYTKEDGFLLFEDMKLGWKEELKPDYVLIDSRTGDTDILGICTRQLPDSVVLMFTPNEQNLIGLENVCRDIRREATEGLKKTIRLHFVAANVPDLDDEKGILRRQKQAFRERLSFKEFSGEIRRYENLNLLDQSIFTLDRPHSRLARSYRRLLRVVLKDNLADHDGAMIFLRDYPKRIETRDPGEAGVFSSDLPLPPLTSTPPPSAPPAPGVTVPLMWRSLPVSENTGQGQLMVHTSDGRSGCCIAYWRDLYSLHLIGQSFKDDVEILNRVAKCFILEEDFGSAIKMFDHVLRSQPNSGEVLLNRAICKVNLGLVDEAAEDLLACLRLPRSEPSAEMTPGKWLLSASFHTTALAKLRTIAPARMVDVADLLETQALQGVDPELIASCLCDTEEGIPRAAQIMRNCVARLDKTESVSASFLRNLLRAHCWKEVIQLYEAGRIPRAGRSVLEVALAYWGNSGEMPESLCREALESAEQELDRWGLQAIALLLWRTGQVTDSIECLNEAERRARAEMDDSFSTEKDDEIFSYWRLRTVSIGQYLDDCQSLRRMFQGESLRPDFLGPVSTRTPA